MGYERSWNDSIYCVTDSQGTNGAVAFGEDRRQFVAAFFAEQLCRLSGDEQGIHACKKALSEIGILFPVA